MPISRHHSGQWLYQFDKIIQGSRQRANRVLPKGWTKKQAEEFDRVETARLYALASGITKTQPLIDDAVLLYLKQHAPTLKNCVDLTAALKGCHSYYSGKPLTALAEVARKYAEDHFTLLSSGTIRNRMAYLRAACRWAWKHHGMGEHDPAERMVLAPASKPRQLYFDRAAMLKIARAITHRPSRTVFRVAFYTGLRISEVLKSQPVETVGGLGLGIYDSKNGRPHIVPANVKILHLVRSSDWPPKIHKDTASHNTKKAMRALGMGEYRFHDTRHSAASQMIQAGVSLNTVGAVLNHKSAVSTKIYAHLATQQLADAIATIGKKSVKISQPTKKTKAL